MPAHRLAARQQADALPEPDRVLPRAVIALILFASSACSHLANESYLRQGCRDYAAALSQLAQLRSAGRVTADQIARVDEQNLLVVGDPGRSRYGMCTTLYEPSNPSGADATVKYGRNVLRGIIDEANAATPVPADSSPSVVEQAATYVHLHAFESVAFEAWDDIRSDVIIADRAWGE